MRAIRTAGPRLRRIFDSSKTPGFGRWPGDRGRTGTRSRRARAASRPGSQHGDLGELLGRAVAVLGQPADVSQASHRPPCADEVAVDVGAVAGDDVAKMLLMSEREDGDVEERVALGRLGPVDDTGDLVTVDEDVVDLQVAVDEHRCPRPERSLGELAVTCDQVGGKDVVGDEPLAFAVEARCELVDAPAGPWW